ncbi:hypothetical protein B0T22DRAFT_455897 [Podospora appendiculata]|uniref:Uncharacterized protein n=1 Tax=Podospora appendiculata TaxID=314037 RepID=A0AAE0XMK8_9PEZI|nr:hypothetical protein B0T22DRAFT_455897 [Podospora appendiculata]
MIPAARLFEQTPGLESQTAFDTLPRYLPAIHVQGVTGGVGGNCWNVISSTLVSHSSATRASRPVYLCSTIWTLCAIVTTLGTPLRLFSLVALWSLFVLPGSCVLLLTFEYRVAFFRVNPGDFKLSDSIFTPAFLRILGVMRCKTVGWSESCRCCC